MILTFDSLALQFKDYTDSKGHCIKEKLLLTPHIAWTSDEALESLVNKIAENIAEFKE